MRRARDRRARVRACVCLIARWCSCDDGDGDDDDVRDSVGSRRSRQGALQEDDWVRAARRLREAMGRTRARDDDCHRRGWTTGEIVEE